MKWDPVSLSLFKVILLNIQQGEGEWIELGLWHFVAIKTALLSCLEQYNFIPGPLVNYI